LANFNQPTPNSIIAAQAMNTLLSEPSSLADQKGGKLEHTMMNTANNDPTLHGTVPHGTIPETVNLKSKFHSGNSPLNFNQELHTQEHVRNADHAMTTLQAELKSQEVYGEVQPHENRAQDSKIQELDIPLITPVKRSKRREDSVDEDSSTRAERLKAKKNVDPLGMSEVKSFLSFPNARIRSTITSLGISLGNDVEKGIDNITELEYN
jgi:hypothetical protein